MSIALITGGTRGLGLDPARALARAGHRATITGRTAGAVEATRAAVADAPSGRLIDAAGLVPW